MADNGLSSAENVARLVKARMRWISRVPETSQEAGTALAVADARLRLGSTLRFALIAEKARIG